MRTIRMFVVAALAAWCPAVSVAQDAEPPAAMTAAELAEALRRAGVALPEGFEVREDGGVSVPRTIADAIAADPNVPVLSGDAAGAEARAAMVDAGVAAPLPGDTLGDAVPTRKPPAWDHKIDIAGNLSDGNSETLSFRAGYAGVRETESSKLTLDASYAYATNDGVSNQNRATAGVNHDWLIKDSRWLYFAGGRADYDQFNSWRYRVNANGGVGYTLIDREKLSLVLRAGAGLSREFGSGRDEIIPEGLLGADLDWDIAENQSLIVTTRYFPDLGDFTEFRTVSTLAWRLDLDTVNDGLGITAGVSHRYQTVVDPGTERNDVDVYAGLTWDF